MSPCYEITLNGRLLCRAGGEGCIFLSADLGGGHIGPIGLLVHGLIGENSDNPEHVYWVNKTLDEGDDVIFKLLDINDVDASHQEIRIVPQIVERSNLALSVHINEKYVCTADIAELDNVGASLRWAKKNAFCEVNVHSSSNSELIPQSKEWCTRRLLVGDIIHFQTCWSPVDSKPA